MTQHDMPLRRPPREAHHIRTADLGAGPDFERADRHSRRVRFLRWALPAVIVIGVAGYLLTTAIPSLDLPIDFESVVVSGEGVAIEQPELSGHQESGEFYSLSAARAIQRSGTPNQLALEDVEAVYELPSGTSAQFSAPEGEYNSRTTVMSLSGGVSMAMGDGVNLRLQEVTVDIPNNLIVSPVAFELEAGNLLIAGNRLEITADGLIVSGGIRTTIGADGSTSSLPRIGAGE